MPAYIFIHLSSVQGALNIVAVEYTASIARRPSPVLSLDRVSLV